MNQYTITQLNDGTIDSFSPQIDGDRVIWAGSDGNDNEIFLYDGSETVQFTDNNVEDSAPRLNGDNVVWLSGEDSQSEVFFNNGNETIQLTDNLTLDSGPVIDGDNIAWSSGAVFDRQVFLYEGSETIRLTNDDLDNTSIDISDGNTVWSSEDFGVDSEIFLYNGSETTQIAERGSFPQISGDNIVWESGSFGDREIFFYNGSETIQLTDNNVEDSLGSNFPFSENIDGDNVVWQSGFGNDSEIFFYNGSETIQLTDNNVRDFNPQISGNNVIWQSAEGTGFESGQPTDLFLATPLEIESIPGAVYRFFNNDTGVHFYTANETERDVVLDSDNFSYEGASYQGVDPVTGADSSLPVYRFLNSTTGAHFYTPSAAERDAVEELPDYQSEGVAYYALPLDSEAI